MIDPGASFAEHVAVLERRIAELERAAGRGPGDWQPLTLASANWTQTRTPQWRINAGNIELRGLITKTTFPLSLGGTLFSTSATGNPPAPSVEYRVAMHGQVAASTPDYQPIDFVWDLSGTPLLRTTTVTLELAVGDVLFLDGARWPIN